MGKRTYWYMHNHGVGTLATQQALNAEGPSSAPDMLDWQALEAATQCLKSVAHPVRLRILELLLDGDHCVGDLARLCEVDQPTISAHLGQLRDRGILDQSRQGRIVYYRVVERRAIEGIIGCMRNNFGSSTSGNGRRD